MAQTPAMVDRSATVQPGQPQHHRQEGGDQADAGENRDLLQSWERGEQQPAIADQGRQEAQGDSRQHLPQPFTRGSRLRVEQARAVMQAVVDRDSDQAGAEQECGHVQLAEQSQTAKPRPV